MKERFNGEQLLPDTNSESNCTYSNLVQCNPKDNESSGSRYNDLTDTMRLNLNDNDIIPPAKPASDENNVGRGSSQSKEN